jgi:hypothetical protein
MSFLPKIAAALAALCLPAGASSAATIGGAYYAPQYDFSEFFTATDGKPFRVVLAGNPFPAADEATVARDLLPVMQAARPRPALTFTYDVPAERPRPDYRLVLVAGAANDLGGEAVCRGDMRLQAVRPGRLDLFAVYCRNDQLMSSTTAWTPAASPTDPQVAALFRELFQVVFSDSPALRPNQGGGIRR